MNLGWLLVFIVYSVLLLGVGYWGYTRESREDYAVAGRNLSTPLATATWLATFQSGVVVVGISGFASLYGYTMLTYLGIAVAILGVLFTLLAARLRETGAVTVPEIIETRYGDRTLRFIATCVVIFLSGVAVTIQLYSAGLVLHGVTGLPVITAIVLVGVVLAVYTTMGGMVSVVRTDAIQSIAMGIGVVTIAGVLLAKVGPGLFVVPSSMGPFAGPVPNLKAAISWLFVWIPGVLSQSFYLQRFYACKDRFVARKMAAYGGLLSVLFYTCILIIGLGAHHLLPADSLGDLAYPTLLKTVVGGFVGVIGLILLIAAIQSSVDSLLHIMGTYFAEDVYARLRPSSTPDGVLRVARAATLIAGIVTIIMAVVMALRPLPLIIQLQALSQGTMGATLVFPIFAGLFWKGATRAGAYGAMLGGLITTVVTFFLKSRGLVNVFHESFPGLVVAAVLFVGLSLLTRKSGVAAQGTSVPMQ